MKIARKLLQNRPIRNAELRSRGAAQGLWRVEVQGAASGWAAAAGFDVRSERQVAFFGSILSFAAAGRR